MRAPSDSLRLIAAPLASGGVALELLVYGSLGDLNFLAVGLAAAALVFVMIRLTLPSARTSACCAPRATRR